MSVRAVLILIGVCASLGVGAVAPGTASRGPLLLADDTRVPHVRVAWTRADGSRAEYRADLTYGSPEDRESVGENLQAFVGLGGSRLEKGAGHPEGAIVRVGFFKSDREGLFFTDIAHGSEISIELRNVAFNQPAVPDPRTLVHRLEYKVEDVEACGLTVDQTEMFNVASADDDMGGSILPAQARFSSLDASEPGEADVDLLLETDGSITLLARVPYRLLRHKGDPWGLEVPGTFFEPFRFDLEFQVLPEMVAEAEGARCPRAEPAQ